MDSASIHAPLPTVQAYKSDPGAMNSQLMDSASIDDHIDDVLDFQLGSWLPAGFGSLWLWEPGSWLPEGFGETNATPATTKWNYYFNNVTADGRFNNSLQCSLGPEAHGETKKWYLKAPYPFEAAIEKGCLLSQP